MSPYTLHFSSRNSEKISLEFQAVAAVRLFVIVWLVFAKTVKDKACSSCWQRCLLHCATVSTNKRHPKSRSGRAVEKMNADAASSLRVRQVEQVHRVQKRWEDDWGSTFLIWIYATLLSFNAFINAVPFFCMSSLLFLTWANKNLVF